MDVSNIETGEIGNLVCNSEGIKVYYDDGTWEEYNSLADLCKVWEDASGSFWIMNCCGTPEYVNSSEYNSGQLRGLKEIGNSFATGVEVECAVKKLQALQRLKEAGLRFNGWETWEKITGLYCPDVSKSYGACFTFDSNDRLERQVQIREDLNFLFGGIE